MTPLHALADRYPWLRRASLLILAAGGLVAYLAMSPHIPHDHQVAIRLRTDQAAALTEFEATWTPVASQEPLIDSRLNFAAGSAPREVRTTVRAPHGDFLLELRLVGDGQTCRSHQRVSLLGDSARVAVDCPDWPTPDSSQTDRRSTPP